VIRFGAAVVVALFCWSIAHHTSDRRDWITDTGLYEKYGDATARGAVPYRDFRLEYPPGALPAFVLPSLGHEGDRAAYDRWFDREMLVCWCLVVLGVALLTPSRVALAVTAAGPLLIGPVALTRFDAWPTALAILAVATFVRRRLTLSAVLLGLAIAVKLWPAVLLPLLVVRLGRRRGAAFTVGVATVVAAVFVPFLVLSPAGLWHSFHQQLARPLQIESLGGAVLIAVHHLFGTRLGIVSTFGSQNLIGPGTHAVAIASTVLLVAALVAVWAWGRELLPAAAACVAALLAFGKVLSPQFLLWIIPFAAVVPDLATTLLLVGALLLTQAYFPRHYWDFAVGLNGRESLAVLARDLAVFALFAVTAWRSGVASSFRRGSEASRASPSAASSSGS
jgi:hypothetical protein